MRSEVLKYPEILIILRIGAIENLKFVKPLTGQVGEIEQKFRDLSKKRLIFGRSTSVVDSVNRFGYLF